MKVDLPQDVEHHMRALVSSGNFGATDAGVVSTALELLERRYDAKKAALRQALQEGERSGIAEDFALEGLLGELHGEPE